MSQRHYIHGDQQNGDSSKFYCSACDVFFEESHFSSREDKCCDHWGKYDAAAKMLGNSVKAHRDFGRPINASNVFSRI